MGNNKYSLHCSDIYLRPFQLSDVDDFMAWARDELVNRFYSLEKYAEREAAYNYIKDTAILHPWFKVICLDNDHPVGVISVVPGLGSLSCGAEVGYYVSSDYWGRGIATLAVEQVVNTIFEEWPHLERLEAVVEVENLASQRVLEKVGFLKEGVLRKYQIQMGKTRDVVMYSFLSTDLSVHN